MLRRGQGIADWSMSIQWVLDLVNDCDDLLTENERLKTALARSAKP